MRHSAALALTILAACGGPATEAPEATPAPDLREGRIEASPATLWDYGRTYDAPGLLRYNPGARLVVDTDGPSVTVESWGNVGAADPLAVGIPVLVDGAIAKVLPTDGSASDAVQLAPGHHRVEVVAGAQQRQGPGLAAGSWPLAVSGLGVTPVSPADGGQRLLVIGDSITLGITNPESIIHAWPILLRPQFSGEVMIDSYGGRSIAEEASAPEAVAAFGARAAAFAPTVVWIELGANDVLRGELGVLREYVRSLCAATKAALPGVRVIWQSMVNEVPERTEQIAGIQAGGCELYDGRQLYDVSMTDGLHPNADGQVHAAGVVAAFFR